MARNIDSAAVAALKAAFGVRLHTSEAILQHHSHGESWHTPALPDAVLMVHSIDDVITAARICTQHQLPIVPFGAGSSVEGQVIPVEGGLSLNFSEMNKIVKVRPEDFDVTVQPGVTRKQLNEALRHHGLFFPVDPGANATLGGMVATRASGTTSVRYGTMRDNVVSLTIVTAAGQVVRTASRAVKSSAGYDLTRLMIGSEGTLGIITDITLRLHPIPEAISAAVVSFDNIEMAVEAVIATLQHAVPIARIELLDDLAIEAINRYSKTEHAVKPTLFLEFHGSSSGVREQAELVGELCAELGGSEFVWKTREEERNALWEARHNAAPAAMNMRPGCGLLATDACVPLSQLSEAIRAARADLDTMGLQASLVGHVGDGNFHLALPVDHSNPSEIALVKEFCTRLAERTIAMGGTCTGEHGIGVGKQQFLTAELSEAIPLMRAIKQALDPGNILNPGKIFARQTT